MVYGFGGAKVGKKLESLVVGKTESWGFGGEMVVFEGISQDIEVFLYTYRCCDFANHSILKGIYKMSAEMHELYVTLLEHSVLV